jgi:NHL repeat-containing protein
MGIRWLMGRNGRARAVPMLAAAVLVPAMMAAASGPAAAGPRASGRVAPAGVITTMAGGAGGPGRATSVGVRACGVSLGNGSLYVASSWSVRKVSPATDALTTPAGTGARGPVADGRPAPRASLYTCGTSVDAAGNLLIADVNDNRLRVVASKTGTSYGQAMTAGHIYTIAGTGKRGFSGDGGPAASAQMNGPISVVLDAAGNLVVSDFYNGRIRVVAERTGTFYGQAMTTGDIYTVAGGGSGGDGGPATSASLFGAHGATVDGAGNLVIADTQDSRVRVVAVHTGTFYGMPMTAGDIYTVAGTGVPGFSADGVLATKAKLSTPEGVAVDAAGNLLIADQGQCRLRLVAANTGTFYGQAMTADHIYTVAGDGTEGSSGDGGPATSAELDTPDGVAVDTAGDLVIADFGSNRVRLVAEQSGTFYGRAMTAGDIYTVAGNGTAWFSGDAGPATHAELGTPAALNVQTGLAVDAAGNVLLADDGNNRVRLVAATSGSFYGQAMTAGDIYTVAGDGTQGFSGDGGAATRAELGSPSDVAIGASGNVLLADSGNNRVRLVAARSGTFFGRAMTAGHIYTVAGNGTAGFAGDGGPATSAELSFPEGVAVDVAGNVLVADVGTDRVRLVAAKTGTFYGRAMTAGHIYTVAGGGTSGLGDGGPATSALLDGPADVAVDATGNLVVADTFDERIRVVAAKSGTFYGRAMKAGDIYTIAGDGDHGFFGDGGPATQAELAVPASVAVDSAGSVAIADLRNNRVRVVAAKTGTFYGQPMTAGHIYTVAGDGFGGFFGDGNQATKAELNNPGGVVAGPDGSLLIADSGSGRVRMLAG